MTIDEADTIKPDLTIAMLKRELHRSFGQGEEFVARGSAQIHRAIDQLRSSGCNHALLKRLEDMSCVLIEFQNATRAGLRNAAESKRLRLQTAIRRL